LTAQLTPLFNEAHIKEHVEILGVHDSTRCADACSRPAKRTTIRTCATPRATYGWVSRSPTQKENDVHEQAGLAGHHILEESITKDSSLG